MREQLLSQCFTPSTPVNDADLFAGRLSQREEIAHAIRQPGQHVVLFGERGVGKTSLANVLAHLGSEMSAAVRVTCDSTDTFASVWRKAASELAFTQESAAIGFAPRGRAIDVGAETLLPAQVTPDDVRRLLQRFAIPVVIVDEFDRLPKAETKLFADTIKTLSDRGIDTTLVIVGVADSVDGLIADHASVERALVQVAMPRMSDSELREIVSAGLKRADMAIDPKALTQITRLSQGLPHYTHLLAQHAALAAVATVRTLVAEADVHLAIERAVSKAQESIKSAHHRATSSPQKVSLYPHVLLACALAPLDVRGYFAAADVREPLARIMGRRLEIPTFSQHLNSFCEDTRGPILQRIGEQRRYRFRFVNPLMQPYVIMDGISRQLIDGVDDGADLVPKAKEREQLLLPNA